MSLLSTPSPAGFGSAKAPVRLQVTVDRTTLDTCPFKFEGGRQRVYRCVIPRPPPSRRPVVSLQNFRFEASAPLSSSNRFHEIGEGRLTVTADPTGLNIEVSAGERPEFRGYDMGPGFESETEAMTFARRVLAAQPGAVIRGEVIYLVGD